MNELVGNWAIGSVSRIEPISSYWGNVSSVTTTDGRCFILKKKPGPAEVERESTILGRLSELGAPVAVPIRTASGAWYASSAGQAFCLYFKLPGAAIKEHYAGDAAGRARMFGRAIGRLHTCLLKCDSRGGYADLGFVDHIREWAMPTIREHKTALDVEAVEKHWQGVERDWAVLYDELPKQLIHRDVHPGNMLFESDRLTGLLDFEMVVRGPRIFDVSYCGTSLLASAYPDAEKMGRWPILFQALIEGYQEFCSLTPAELQAFLGTMAAIQVLCTAFNLQMGNVDAARCDASLLGWLLEKNLGL